MDPALRAWKVALVLLLAWSPALALLWSATR